MWHLARKLLFHDRVKFLIAGAGVSVSVFLVLVQLGLYFGFMENASNLIDHAHADIWVAGVGNENFDLAGRTDERAFYRVLQTQGVAHAERMVLAWGQMKMPSGGSQGVEIVGIERGSQLFRPWNIIDGDDSRISEIDGVIVDHSEFPKLHMNGVGDRREVSGLSARVVALTDGIRSFTTSPFLFTNIQTARAYTGYGPDSLTYILVRAVPGVDMVELKARLNRLPALEAFTAREFSGRARTYWSERTGVGVGFFMTATMGLIVGMVIVGQILYNATLDHSREYGTMKAMGAENVTVMRVVLYQALISAAVGVTAGLPMAFGMSRALRLANLNVLLYPWVVVVTVLGTAVMCAIAALIPMLKIIRLDPALVFKG
jgi:putative ABC transport system permease protein